MRTIHRDIVSAVLLSKDGKLLQALKPENEWSQYPGYWCILGGGVDQDEDKRTALDRELMEEVGIDISSCPAELVYQGKGEGQKTLKSSGERVIVQMDFIPIKSFLIRTQKTYR